MADGYPAVYISSVDNKERVQGVWTNALGAFACLSLVRVLIGYSQNHHTVCLIVPTFALLLLTVFFVFRMLRCTL